MIDLRWTGRIGSEGGRPGRAMRIAGFQPDKKPYQTSSLITLPSSWDRYLASKSSKCRSEIRRVLRRMFEQGDVEFVRHRPDPARVGGGDPRWDLYQECELVAGSSWQSRVSNGNTLSTDRVRDFLRDAHQAASRLGMVDLNLLRLDGQPVAFAYNYQFEGRIFGLRTGFDPASASGGLGTALLLRSLEDSCRRKDHSVDLGIGNWDFKRRLRNGVETSYQYTHTPLSNVKSQAIRLSQWAKSRIGMGPVEIESKLPA